MKKLGQIADEMRVVWQNYRAALFVYVVVSVVIVTILGAITQ